jgi:hypothetical protein
MTSEFVQPDRGASAYQHSQCISGPPSVPGATVQLALPQIEQTGG